MTITKRLVQSIREQFGSILRQRLEAKGIKHKFVAKQLGVSPAYFAKLLKGEETPSDEAILIIADILGESPQKLMQNIKYPANLSDMLLIESEG